MDSQITIELFAGTKSNGKPVQEEVLVQPLEGEQYKVLQSPGFVLGIAAGDVIKFIPSSSGKFELLSRGGNICIQIFKNSGTRDIKDECIELSQPLGGRLDGLSEKQMVLTFPYKDGFQSIEKVMNRFSDNYPDFEWYYGNVYDTEDGETPLNWWEK
jgi:hypothetical protein